jgi:hypothetical protein
MNHLQQHVSNDKFSAHLIDVISKTIYFRLMTRLTMQKTPIWILIAAATLLAAIGLAVRGLLLPADRWTATLFMKIPDVYIDSNTPLTFIFLLVQTLPAVVIGFYL